MGGVLKCTSEVGAEGEGEGEGEEPAAGGEAAVGLLHGVAEVFEGVVGSDDADLVVGEGPALVEVSCDVAAVEVNGFIAGGRVEAAAEVDLSRVVETEPAFRPSFSRISRETVGHFVLCSQPFQGLIQCRLAGGHVVPLRN